MGTNYWQSLDHDCCYRIYNRAVDDIKLFKDHSDYLRFFDKYKEFFSPYFDTYAYCLIPNHFHFIIRVKSKEAIAIVISKENSIASNKITNNQSSLNDFLINQLKRLFSSHSLYYNKKYDRRGQMFLEKVKRIFIENTDRLRYLIGYVHHNPSHHHISTDYSSWKYSSYKGILSMNKTSIAKAQVLNLFQGTEQFLEYHKGFKLMKLEKP